MLSFSFQYNCFWVGAPSFCSSLPSNYTRHHHRVRYLILVRLIQLDGMHTQTDGNDQLTQNAHDKKQRMLHKCSAAFIPS